MKYFITSLLLFLISNVFAQSFLVPFNHDKLYGLMNEKGRIVVEPEFDEVTWLSGRYFKTSRSFHSNDTIETSPGNFYIQNGKLELTGIYYGDKAILKDEPFSAYEIVLDKCVVAKCDKRLYQLTKENYIKYGDKGKFVSLFNLAGKNVYPKNFRSLQKIDSAGKHPSLKGHSRYILFAAEKSDTEKGFFVYDAGGQKISEWLVEGLTKVKLINANERERTFTFASVDPSGSETRYKISAGETKFYIEKLPERERNERVRRKGFQGSDDEIEERIVTIDGFSDEAVPVFYSSEPDSVLRKRFRPFYSSSNDSLFHVVYTDEKKFIQIPSGYKPIFLRSSKGRIQDMPFIIKAGSKFFLADSSGVQRNGYDSMVYFGSNYLVWKKTGDKWVCGTIGRNGKAIIPMVYDSISAGMIRLDSKHDSRKDSSYLVFTNYKTLETRGVERSPYVVSISPFLLAHRSGRSGILNEANDTLLPFAYNLIAENDINFLKPRETEFIILKKDGLYGVAKKQYLSTQPKQRVKIEVEPVFPYVPVFVYENYYGIPGLAIYGLYDEGFKFRGFGRADGRMIKKRQ